MNWQQNLNWQYRYGGAELNLVSRRMERKRWRDRVYARRPMTMKMEESDEGRELAGKRTSLQWIYTRTESQWAPAVVESGNRINCQIIIV